MSNNRNSKASGSNSKHSSGGSHKTTDSEFNKALDFEDKMHDAGSVSKERRQKAKVEKEKKAKEDRQMAMKAAMLKAGKKSKERREGKGK